MIPRNSAYSRLVSTAILSTVMALSFSPAANAQMRPTSEDAPHAFSKQKTFSPYAGRNFPTQVFWGDTHLHTSQSMDAGSFGTRLMPEDAHRFARGEEVTSSGGLKVKLSRPLDFLVVADHSDNLGFFPALFAGDPQMLEHPQGREWYNMVQEGGQTGVAAGLEIVFSAAAGEMPEELEVLPTSDRFRSAWEATVAAAEKYNEPGRYTAFHGYEWTSMPGGDNLHRVVVLRDGGDEAMMMMPYTVVPPLGSDDPRDLWKWMEAYEEKNGGRALALAHNGNLSNGQMFPTTETFNGKPVDAEYVRNRIKWEPLYEITQIKGDGETHPFLSPDDEFADYETWDQVNVGGNTLKTNEMLQFEYARAALGLGMQLEQKLGENPYKFGFVGSTDSHTGLATAQEDNFFGKHSGAEPAPERVDHPVFKIGDLSLDSSIMTSSGLAAVWARENTREALFDAMKNKETYSTTGSRILVRFFGGWNFTEADAQHRLPADIGYEKGVPMGGDLIMPPDGASPSFLVAALRDPYSGNLDRIQIVKVWIDASGEQREKVFDVVWSGERVLDANGKLPAVGNTVDVANATWTNSIGSPELIAAWTDPEFDASISAAYYARVLEIPTPRWTAYEAQRFGITMKPDVPMVTVERAYTSPIWYTP